MAKTDTCASGVILAGGQSRRMGRDKAFFDFGGAPLITRVIERVQSVCVEIIIVANDTDAYARFGVRVVSDVYPGKGSLGGVYSGLRAARERYALAVACDMPFLNESLLRYLISLAPQADVVIPRVEDPSSHRKCGESSARRTKSRAKEIGLQPMHAAYSKNCLAPMEERLRADDLRLIGFLDAVRIRVVESWEVNRFDPQHLSFFNVNTPEEWKLALSLLDEKRMTKEEG